MKTLTAAFLSAVLAAFFFGMALQKHLDRRALEIYAGGSGVYMDGNYYTTAGHWVPAR